MGSTTTVYNLYHLAHNADQGVSRTLHCHAGHSVSDNSSIYPMLLADLDIADPESESEGLIVNNCTNSLQILSTDTISMDQLQDAAIINNTVSLLSPQLFVSNIADPPRLA